MLARMSSIRTRSAAISLPVRSGWPGVHRSSSDPGPNLHPDTGQSYKVRKVPVGPEGRPASPCGLPLNEALKRARAHGGGLGIMLRAGDGLFCLDIDLHASALTPDSEAIHQLVRRLGGWAHLSPSGHGIHIVGRAQLTEDHPRRLTLPELGLPSCTAAASSSRSRP